MSKRDKFIARMKSQLEEGKAELYKLESKVGNAQEGVREKYLQTIRGLREKWVAAETKLEQIERSGEEVWGDLEEEAERTWTAFKAGMDVFRDFLDHS